MVISGEKCPQWFLLYQTAKIRLEQVIFRHFHLSCLTDSKVCEKSGLHIIQSTRYKLLFTIQMCCILIADLILSRFLQILAGLLDQYTMADSARALKMMKWMVDYFYNRVQRVIKEYTIERHWLSLNEETGGMNDILYRLYSTTVRVHHMEI